MSAVVIVDESKVFAHATPEGAAWWAARFAQHAASGRIRPAPMSYGPNCQQVICSDAQDALQLVDDMTAAGMPRRALKVREIREVITQPRQEPP